MTLRLTEEQDAALTALAKAQGVSKQEAVTRAIQWKFDRMQAENAFDDALTDTLTRYPETIRRLGE